MGAVRLWDAETGACARTLEGHGDAMYSVCFSPDGRRLASGSNDRTVRLWDVETGACIILVYSSQQTAESTTSWHASAAAPRHCHSQAHPCALA